MTPPLSIVTANANHVNAIEACATSAYAIYLERMRQTPAPMVANFAELVSQGKVLVALSEKELLGYVVFYPIDNAVHLENLALFPEHQAKGLGKQLIQHVEHYAHTHQMREVNLYTNVAMHENIGMYKHLGYIELERKTVNGFDRIYFRKPIP